MVANFDSFIIVEVLIKLHKEFINCMVAVAFLAIMVDFAVSIHNLEGIKVILELVTFDLASELPYLVVTLDIEVGLDTANSFNQGLAHPVQVIQLDIEDFLKMNITQDFVASIDLQLPFVNLSSLVILRNLSFMDLKVFDFSSLQAYYPFNLTHH